MEYNQAVSQICNQCGGNLRPLFLSLFCPVCENKSSGMLAGDNVGYIVWRSRPPGSCEYVFKTVEDATRWRAAAKLDQFPIRKVRNSGSVFRWRQSSPSCPDSWIADQLYEIFPIKDHGPGPNRAYLVNDGE